MIYFISDTHFNHHNILSYEPESRPFADIHGMNEYIIERWNEKITDEDKQVYIAFCTNVNYGKCTAIDNVVFPSISISSEVIANE